MNKGSNTQIAHQAPTWMITSALLAALQTLVFKTLSSSLPTDELMLLRYISPCLVMWVIFYFKPCSLWHRTDNSLFVWRAILLVSSQCCLYIYLFHSSVLNATLLYLSSPLWVPVINRCFSGTKLSTRTCGNLLLGFTGVICLEQGAAFHHSMYVLFGLASGILNAGSQIANHRISHKMSAQTNTLGTYSFTVLAGAIACAILYCLPNSILSNQMISLNKPIILGLLGLTLVGLSNQICRSRAYAIVRDPASIINLLYLSVPISGAIDWFYFHRAPSMLGVCGTIIIISSCLLTIKQKPREK
jgi:drug/metabolite transporter (DMT)-like permease